MFEQDDAQDFRQSENDDSRFSENEPLGTAEAEPAERELSEEPTEAESLLVEKDAEIQGYVTRLQRLQADYENLKRRAQKEKSEIGQWTKESLIGKLLPVIDNFERALDEMEREQADLDAVKEGVRMVYRQMTDILCGEGLQPIKAKGEPFDCNYHEALMQVDSEQCESNQIVDELQKGYTLNDKVIRPAKVSVAR